MAIKRLDPAARFRVISQMDEAVIKDDIEDAAKRYEEYLQDFDASKLKLKEGIEPTYFILRPLKNIELADINSRYLLVDPQGKTTRYRDQIKMFLEMFDLCCEGTQDGAEPIQKVSSGDFTFQVASEIGSLVSFIATLGKNLKKA